MELLVYILATLMFIAMTNIGILIGEVKTLKKEMLELRSIIRKRQAGQSWEKIDKLEGDQELLDKFFNSKIGNS